MWDIAKADGAANARHFDAVGIRFATRGAA
jgi:hypothetical protein